VLSAEIAGGFDRISRPSTPEGKTALKGIGEMSLEELAGFVCQALMDVGVTVTLSGGSWVAIWSQGKYVSYDLDFIEEGPASPMKVRDVLVGLGFKKGIGRHFLHPQCQFSIEFPTGALAVGDEVVTSVITRKTAMGSLRLLTPTDTVKDRLAAFYHWKDSQALEQALLVARAQPVDLKDIARWSKSEGHQAKFQTFKSLI
jgi:hypothetical protein